jgi:hypothetical protein
MSMIDKKRKKWTKKDKKCHLNKNYTNKTDGKYRKYNMRIL